jgi:hypothetical protein
VPMLQFLDVYHRNETASLRGPDAGHFVYIAYGFILQAIKVTTRVITEADGMIVRMQERRWHSLLPSNRAPVLNSCPKGRLKTLVYIRQLDHETRKSPCKKRKVMCGHNRDFKRFITVLMPLEGTPETGLEFDRTQKKRSDTALC